MWGRRPAKRACDGSEGVGAMGVGLGCLVLDKMELVT